MYFTSDDGSQNMFVYLPLLDMLELKKDSTNYRGTNYATEIVNGYIIYDLDAWPRNPNNNFKFENCLFDANNIVKDSDKEKWVYSDNGITFDSEGSWNFTLLEML